MSARPTRSISSIVARRRNFSAACSRWAKAASGGFTHSPLYLDFLAGNQEYHCTPWGMPTRNVFGWQKPCYLLGEGYVGLVQGADGDDRLGQLWHRPLRKVRQLHGPLRLRADGRPRGDRASARNPWTTIRGVKTRGPMAPEISLERQRPAEYVFARHVQTMMAGIPQRPRPERRALASRRDVNDSARQSGRYVVRGGAVAARGETDVWPPPAELFAGPRRPTSDMLTSHCRNVIDFCLRHALAVVPWRSCWPAPPTPPPISAINSNINALLSNQLDGDNARSSSKANSVAIN